MAITMGCLHGPPVPYNTAMDNKRAGILRRVDCVTVPVPDLETGIAFYSGGLGHQLSWRNDEIGQAGLKTPDSATEIVLTTEHAYEPGWLVESIDAAVPGFTANGGHVLHEAEDIAVGRVAVVEDPFGNSLVLLELSRGLYSTDPDGRVTGVTATGHTGNRDMDTGAGTSGVRLH